MVKLILFCRIHKPAFPKPQPIKNFWICGHNVLIRRCKFDKWLHFRLTDRAVVTAAEHSYASTRVRNVEIYSIWPQKTFYSIDGYIDVGDGCWWRMLETKWVKTIKCWWRFWMVTSGTNIEKITSNFRHQHPQIVTNFKSLTLRCHQQQFHQKNLNKISDIQTELLRTTSV